MKKLSLVLALAATFAVQQGFAQGEPNKQDETAEAMFDAPAQKGKTPPSPEKRAEHATKKMTKLLTLTPEQVASVTPINLKLAQDLAAIHPLRETDKKAFHEKRKALFIATDAQLNAVLTTEQQKIWAAYKAGQKDAQRGGGKGKPKGKAKGK